MQAASEWNLRMKVSLLHAHVVGKTSNLKISHRRYAKYRKTRAKIGAKIIYGGSVAQWLGRLP